MNGEWTTADYALIVGISSSAIALFSLGWNIWSSFIYPKPKVRVTAARCYTDKENDLIISESYGGMLPIGWTQNQLTCAAISLEVLNFGPGVITLDNVIAKKHRFSRKSAGTFFLSPFSSYPHDLNTVAPLAGGLPSKIDVGETHTAYLPLNLDWFISKEFRYLGFLDTFGRRHFAKYKDIRAIVNSAQRKSVG